MQHLEVSLRPLAALCLLLLGLPSACTDPADEASARSDAVGWTFTDITLPARLDFRYTFGDEEFSCILEDTGSGCALIDANNDGFLDLYLVNGCYLEGVSDPGAAVKNSGATNRLYLNLWNGQFQDVTAASGVGDPGYGMGAVVGDHDADGDEDLYVLNRGRNVLYRNDGYGVFEDVTQDAGVAGPERLNGQPPWSVNGQFLDLDRDGDLDLYVASYLAFDPSFVDPDLPEEYPYPGPESYAGQRSILYRNDGRGHFEEITAAAGLLQENGRTMGAAFADLDDDGDVDIFEAVDGAGNFLFENRGDGTFRECADEAAVALDRTGRPMASMHASVGDIDGDGRLDLFVPDLESGCLYRNLGQLRFEEVGAERGLAAALKGSGGWGSTFADFDNDSDLDLLVVLGGAFDLEAGEADKLFLNDGRGYFTLVAPIGPYFDSRNVSRGAAFGDLDNDGDIDFLVSRKDVAGTPHLIRNDLPPGRHWLTLDLRVRNGTEAPGARVELVAAGQRQTREAWRSTSYLSASDPRVHFGLGSAQQIESLRVRWPDGTHSEHAIPAVDRIVRIQQPTP